MIPNPPGFVIISLLYKLLCDIEGSDSILIISIEIVNRAVAVILCMIHKCSIINVFRFLLLILSNIVGSYKSRNHYGYR